MQMTRQQWLQAVGLAPPEVPRLLVLEGSWWRRERNTMRLAYLDNVRELNFPDLYWGQYRGVPLVFCCAYGAPRAVEPVHIFGSVGTPVVVQIGSCGGLQPQIQTGDIVLPERAVVGEGASRYYSGCPAPSATLALVGRLQRWLSAKGFTVHRGTQFSSSSLFAQPPQRVRGWREAGYLGVDMETSAVLTVAKHFGMEAASLLFVWDELLKGRTFLDTFSPEEQERQRRANRVIFEAALELVEGL